MTAPAFKSSPICGNFAAVLFLLFRMGNPCTWGVDKAGLIPSWEQRPQEKETSR